MSVKRELVIEEGAAAHYEDARYYDRAYARRREDIAFYVRACAGSAQVLELGCGSGRVGLALLAEAKTGQSVKTLVGVDASEAMLARYKEKLEAAPGQSAARVSLHRADIRDVRLAQTFSRVIAPFNVVMHLYTREDFERFCATVLAHLSPRGHFVFDVRMPEMRELARSPERVYRGRPVTLMSPLTREKTRYNYRERFDYDPVSQVQEVGIAFLAQGDPSDFLLTPLTQRQFFPQELEALLHYNGLRVVERFGDFEGGALSAESESQVFVCRRR